MAGAVLTRVSPGSKVVNKKLLLQLRAEWRAAVNSYLLGSVGFPRLSLAIAKSGNYVVMQQSSNSTS